MGVAVVTDSTCDLPAALVAELGVRVVPLTVAFGSDPGVARDELIAEDFYRQLAATDDELPTTSQPSSWRFEQVWAEAAAAGHDAVVSLHVSGELSGTVTSARALAAHAPLPVEVVDSRQVSGGLALQVIAVARAAAAGADVTSLLEVASRARRATRSVVAVDTAEYLRRGGRLTAGRAAVGAALRTRPVLAVEDGRIQLVDRARTWRRAVDRLAEAVAAGAGAEPQQVVVAHALHPERAAAVLDAVRDRMEVAEALEVVMGPVVGTHAGPGAVGVAAAPATSVPGSRASTGTD